MIEYIMWNQSLSSSSGVTVRDLDDGEQGDGGWDADLVRGGSGGGGDVGESCE